MNIRKPPPAGAVLAGVVLVLSLALVPAALAGKGSRSGSSSGSTLTGPFMVTDNNGDGLPNWDDTVTFHVSTSASVPSVELDCYQNGAIVYQGSTGYYATYMWPNNYVLKSFNWSGGSADFTVILSSTNKRGARTDLATLSFSVAA